MEAAAACLVPRVLEGPSGQLWTGATQGTGLQGRWLLGLESPSSREWWPGPEPALGSGTERGRPIAASA